MLDGHIHKMDVHRANSLQSIAIKAAVWTPLSSFFELDSFLYDMKSKVHSSAKQVELEVRGQSLLFVAEGTTPLDVCL